MLLGSHLSIAGGLSNALREARRYHFATMAMFVRNQRQWACPPLTEEAVGEFRLLRRKLGIGPVAAHGSYLLNLCGEEEIRRKSIAALGEDLIRCERLGIDYLVIHPGSRADVKEGVRLIAEGLSEVMRGEMEGAGDVGRATGLAAPRACCTRNPRIESAARVQPPPPRLSCTPYTMILLETTAGAGHSIGGRFEELAEVLSLVSPPERVGVCLDTCHVFAAGYDIRSPQAYAETMSRFDAAIGLARLKLVHVNDSKGDLGSRLDRHEHIGEGKIGLEGFANLVRDERLAAVPLILETPKGKDPRGRDWDRLNARALRGLVKG
jgi:deoxyribonuclease-4